MRLRDLRNLGPKSETWLAMADILEPRRLAELGAVEAYRRLQDGSRLRLEPGAQPFQVR